MSLIFKIKIKELKRVLDINTRSPPSPRRDQLRFYRSFSSPTDLTLDKMSIKVLAGGVVLHTIV